VVLKKVYTQFGVIFKKMTYLSGKRRANLGNGFKLSWSGME